MSGASDNHELPQQVAVLEERMKTMKAEYESALDRNNAAIAGLRTGVLALVFGAVVSGITLGLALSG